MNSCDIKEIEFLADKQGNPIGQDRMSVEEEIWHAEIDGKELACFVQLPDGRKGALFLQELTEAGQKNENQVLEKINTFLAPQVKKEGFEVFTGKNSGICGGHEIGGFVEYGKSGDFNTRWETIIRA